MKRPVAEAGEPAEPAAATIRGYASVFGRLDLSGDTIDRGAFAATIRRRGPSGLRMLWQHDPGRPIGVWTSVVEDDVGLFVEGRLAVESAGGREALALIRAGAVDGLSIGFRAVKARRDAGRSRRRLVEIDLWEISIVTFPMQERARVARDAADALPADLAGRMRAGAGRLFGPASGRSIQPSTKQETTCRT